jgi:hypothetical protein
MAVWEALRSEGGWKPSSLALALVVLGIILMSQTPHSWWYLGFGLCCAFVGAWLLGQIVMVYNEQEKENKRRRTMRDAPGKAKEDKMHEQRRRGKDWVVPTESNLSP